MPRWSIIVSRIGHVSRDYTSDHLVSRSECVKERTVDSTLTDPGAIGAFRAAAEMLKAEGETITPLHLQIYLEDLCVLDNYVHSRVEWPFPTFFWKWVDVYSTETRARLCPVSTSNLIGLITRWSELGKKIRLVLDDERREEARRLVLALLPVIPDLGLGPADKDRLYRSTALIAWLAAQPDMVLTSERQRALDDVLSALDALIKP